LPALDPAYEGGIEPSSVRESLLGEARTGRSELAQAGADGAVKAGSVAVH